MFGVCAESADSFMAVFVEYAEKITVSAKYAKKCLLFLPNTLKMFGVFSKYAPKNLQ